MSLDKSSLPTGWEARYDPNVGRTYYINHIDKTSTWDHPCKIKKHVNGTPQSSSYKQKQQTNGTPKNFSNKNIEHISMQDLGNRNRGNSLTVRSKVQESSFSDQNESDEAVSKISAMFPTVSDAHIRLLMKNCRYMKSIFPQAEETIILDILSNHDNSIQKTSQKLREMGFEKKDSLRISQQKQEAKLKNEESKTSSPKEQVIVPKVKSVEEKKTVKIELQKEYMHVPEQLITIALESADFDKDKASDLLKSTAEETKKSEEDKIVQLPETENKGAQEEKQTLIPVSQSRQSLKSLLKSDKGDKEKTNFNRIIDDGYIGNKSSYLSDTKGANPALAKGNDDKLLLEDYVKWLGPNPTLRKGPEPGLAKGPNSTFNSNGNINARGANAAFHKGPNKSLVRGSIFQQMKQSVTIGGESRGK